MTSTSNTKMNYDDVKDKCRVIDCGSGKISTELPMCMREGGEELIAKRKKELEVYVKLLVEKPLSVLTTTATFLNPYATHPAEVGQEQADTITSWWSIPKTQDDMKRWLFTNKHKVNGKFGNWNNGFLGSRWADVEINGRKCRVAFYSRRMDEQNFPPETMGVLDGKNYILMIDPTL